MLYFVENESEAMDMTDPYKDAADADFQHQRAFNGIPEITGHPEPEPEPTWTDWYRRRATKHTIDRNSRPRGIGKPGFTGSTIFPGDPPGDPLIDDVRPHAPDLNQLMVGRRT